MDAIIQRTLKSQLGADVTVITIAHRLRTIMDADKIVRCDVFVYEHIADILLTLRWSLIADT